MEPDIRLEGVSVTYRGGVQALRQVDLAFAPGQFTVLLGQSGAGKSTLLRCLNLLNRPTGGRVLVAGDCELRSGRRLRAHRRQTAMVFQLHQLILHQTALRNAMVGRLAYHSALRTLLPLPKDEVRFALHCLDRVGLLHKAMTRCDQLSGGERQRVGIARALAQRPRYLLADEPVASLDPGTADRVMSLIQRVCDEDGITAVVSLHQIELARRFAERVIGLSDGQVVFDGRPDELTPHDLDVIYHGKLPKEAALPHSTSPAPRPRAGFAQEIEHGVAAING